MAFTKTAADQGGLQRSAGSSACCAAASAGSGLKQQHIQGY
jgi:hypothetical protein